MVEADGQRASNAQAWEMARAFAEHSLFVRRKLRQFGVSFADGDDAVQQVFLVVHRRFADYIRIPFKRTWLFSVSRLVARSYLRGLKRAAAQQRWLMVPPCVDPEEVLKHREASRLVSRFLERLDESQRVPFYLADVEGLTAKEIAAELDVNINTVKSRLRAARRRFKTALATMS
jgi:RNA polymerase sigma-70 factor (ECF subfamily)